MTAMIAAGASSGAAAQANVSAEFNPDVRLAQATPGLAQGHTAQPAQPGTMTPGVMGQGGQGMMGHHGMMGDMMRSGMIGRRGHMMKMMFVIADTDSDGALSFEEVTAIHKRIFGAVDANKDGKVTIEEAETFMRE
jgi:hypothetical protein